jgi:PAS domain S-box-containing protein
MVFTLPATGMEDAVATVSRMAIFVVIGAVVAFLSRRLAASEQQLHDIIEFLPDATFAIDREGRVIAWNRAVEELTGKKKAEMLYKDNSAYSLAFYPDRRPMIAGLLIHDGEDIQKKYPEIQKEAGNYTTQTYLPHFHAGRGAHLRFSARALVDSGGTVTGAIESVRDVTDRVLLETALQKTGSRLNTIAGITRHDISTKLSILYGHLRLAVMKFRDPEVIAFIGRIEETANSIKHQIEISREFREIGTLPPTWIPVQSAVQDAASRLDPGSVAIRAWTARLEVFCDPHLTVVFFHLFHNSLTHGAGAQRILVTYRLLEDGCAILIEDDGSGIPEGMREHLFEKREDSYGRGLFLSSEILSLTGMTISESGSEGSGARFEILIPSEGYRVRGMEA